MSDMNWVSHHREMTDRDARIPVAPLLMPEQNFWSGPTAARLHDAKAKRAVVSHRLVRTAIAVSTLGLSAAFVYGLSDALSLEAGVSALHIAFLLFASLSFSWIAFGAVNATTGVLALMFKKGRDTLELPDFVGGSPPPLVTRSALLFPVYEEDPKDVATTIAELVDDLEATGVHRFFDVFVLSDSQSAAAREREADVFGALRFRLKERMRLSYRNRDQNVGKKAGNIQEWISTFGGAYPTFIVFDADSVMTAKTISRLVHAMERNPDAGLIQTVPQLVGGQTVFACLQQFANRLYGNLSAAGFACWQGDSGNYWGHNAIIRTRAFAQCAGLPKLQGAAPFGGHIQSHDFVEAALLRRAGWRVSMVTTVDGSYEGSPPTFFDLVVRDRRWMQGNLQHAALLGMHGLRAISRVHFIIGIGAYLSSAVWALAIVTGLALTWREAHKVTDYFPDTPTLFPNWPVFDPEAGLRLITATMIVVLVPKLFGLVIELFRYDPRRPRLLRAPATLLGWVLETIIAALLAPVVMVTQVRGLWQIMTGQDSGWRPQQRAGGAVSFAQSLRFHSLHVIIGVLLGCVCLYISLATALWMSPIIAGLVLSPLLSYATSKPAGSLVRAVL
ncbi:MAG: glucans biosynthesis glucosyltransferase MdoH [Pseudomonadota bacterium]